MLLLLVISILLLFALALASVKSTRNVLYRNTWRFSRLSLACFQGTLTGHPPGIVSHGFWSNSKPAERSAFLLLSLHRQKQFGSSAAKKHSKTRNKLVTSPFGPEARPFFKICLRYGARSFEGWHFGQVKPALLAWNCMLQSKCTALGQRTVRTLKRKVSA